MLMKKIALAALIASLSLAGAAVAADKASAEAAIAAAKAAQKAASAVGGEWRDTGKMIKDAEQSAADGNYADAEKLAKKAEAQGMLGKEQALGQKGVGNPGYLYN
jgi:type II secretory pathway pseudopilin PulG